jgi:hypothetical protein
VKLPNAAMRQPLLHRLGEGVGVDLIRFIFVMRLKVEGFSWGKAKTPRLKRKVEKWESENGAAALLGFRFLAFSLLGGGC